LGERSTSRIISNESLIRASLKAGASLVAVSSLLMSATAFAQDDADAQDDGGIVVTGIRQSLANSQNIKRDSDTVVDAITAQDIGALPDRSVTEALQRVPGVAINRFAGSNDPDHFSVEGSGVVIRGLTFVRSEFNGRDAFAAGPYGQGLNFADVPSELLGSVVVSKNATAEMIEGGLAGTVNLNTRKPFDNMGFHIGFSAEANYGDLEKEWTPTGSFLISNTWETGGGTFGLLASGSYSRIRSRSDGLQISNFQTRDGTYVTRAFSGGNIVCRNPLPADTDTQGFPGNAAVSVGHPAAGDSCFGATPSGADGNADYRPLAYAPLGAQFRTQNFDRVRDGQALAAQFETADRRGMFVLQYIRSHTTNSWGERTFSSGSDLSEYNTYPLGCRGNQNGPPVYQLPSGPGFPPTVDPNNTASTRAQCPMGSTFQNYQYDSNNVFESGYITYPGGSWRGAINGSGSPYVPAGGMQQDVIRREVEEEVTNQDIGFNVHYELDDHWTTDFDFDYTWSRKNNLDYSLIGASFADEEIDLTGPYPVVNVHKPNQLCYTWCTASPELTAAAGPNGTDEGYFGDKRFEFWRAAMDHIEQSSGHEYQLRGDIAYDFDEGSFLRQLKVGARYADRDQTVRYTTYNWGMLSEVWSGSRPVNMADVNSDTVEFYDFPDFFRGQVPGPIGAYYYAGDIVDDYNGVVDFSQDVQAKARALGANPSWNPLASRAGVVGGSPFLPSEIQPVRQKDVNAYLMARFESEGDVRISGNVGVRYVHTTVTSTGSIGVPSQAALNITLPYADPDGAGPLNGRCTAVTPPPPAPQVPVNPGGVCNLSSTAYAALQTWAGTGVTVNDVAERSYEYWLPSLNVKFGLTDDVLMRLAVSKVLTRPENSYIRNFLTIGLSPSGELTSQSGNPFLKPATAWQGDLTLEWYFDEVGSLTFDAFYKSVKGFFYQAVTDRSITSNGVTQTVSNRGPENYDGTGKVKGFEIAYQQTYDFLPGFLSGLGLSANYTYIDSSGLPNTFLNGGSLPSTSTVPPGNLPLEQLSKHNINVAAFYEKGPISIRAAYNWRSRFLLTASDVIFPYTSIFNEATGQLDASIFFNVTDQIKIGVQGVNLLNEVTKTSQAFTGDPAVLGPRSYFMNDRRFSFIVRGNF
jgi:TonB-dependent receptor